MLPSHEPSASLDDEVKQQQTVLLFRNVGVAITVNIVNATLLIAVNIAAGASAIIAVLWWLAVVAINLARYALSRRYAAAGAGLAAAFAWRDRYMAATGLSAALWGLGGAFFISQGGDATMLFTALVLAGMIAGAIPILAPVPLAFLIFAITVLTPVIFVVFLQATTLLHWSLGLMTLLFLATTLVSARYLQDTLRVSIRLSLEQRELARRLDSARNTAEAALHQNQKTKATLAASEERYRLILQHLPTGVLHYDNDFIVTYCNDQLARIMRVSRRQILGTDMKTLKDQRLVPALEAALLGEQGVYEGDYIATGSTAHLTISISCAPVRGSDGEIAGGIAIIEDITDRRRAEDEIRRLAFYDTLTHLPNRRLLMERLEQALILGERRGQIAALLILDLDHFKNINDTRGHDVGDQLLIEVAQRITDVLREEDTVSRLGGDEYVILLENLGSTERRARARAEAVVDKIRSALGRPHQLIGTDAEYFNSTSIGLTLFEGHGHTADDLLKQADVALYQAKDEGRNTVRFFDSTMQARVDAKSELESALRRGLKQDEFRLYYQPQVTASGELVGAEALIRWTPRQGKPVSPSSFIPLAEESGLILLIGRWALDRACRQLEVWAHDPATSRLRLSVNVSGRQFRQPDFVEQVRTSVRSSGADPARLTLEITENVLLGNVEEVITKMRALNRFGIGFSLDDFGTGYSSLLYLKRLPIEQLKIDQSFVQDVTSDPNDAAIVQTILAMSQALGVKTIAEGVETEAQFAILEERGCQFFQGHLFGAAVPIEAWCNTPPG